MRSHFSYNQALRFLQRFTDYSERSYYGTSEKHAYYCNFHISAAKCSSLLDVSYPDTSASRVRTFRSKCENFVTKPRFSEVPYVYNEKTFNLERFREFLRYSGVSTSLPAILVAGSKGKGTVANFLARILSSHGKNVGLFTSPYLYDMREMVRVLPGSLRQRLIYETPPVERPSCHTGGSEGSQKNTKIPKKDFARIINDFRKPLETFHDVTFFEILTATALRYFSEKKVDFAVFEVGMGGRIDAVNVVDPLLTILARVEKEHTRALGRTYKEILHEKLGICRPGVPLVLGKQNKWVLNAVKDECRSRNIPVEESGNVSFLIQENASIAVRAAEILLKKLDKNAVESAFSQIPGHFEIRPFPNNRFLVLDVCHTPQSALFFRKNLENTFPVVSLQNFNRKYVFLAAFLRDKNVEGIMKNLTKRGDTVIFTKISHPRAADPRILYKFFTQKWHDRGVHFVLEENMDRVFNKIFLKNRQSIIFCLIGSHYLLREAKNRHLI